MEKRSWLIGSLPLFFLASWLVGCAAGDRPQAALNPRDFTAHLIGHAHIDLAWLWRWEETIHDIATHTFRGTLAQMEKMPGLTFAQSQPAIYEAVEKHYPELFQKIREKVEAGTWIPVGGMWVEPDLNMPDGESLARQLLYGKRYFREKFGLDITVGWNPDSFGHSFQLPQILSKAGIKYYVFERCEPGVGPVFWWEGADGSRVLAYVPHGWYLVDLKNGVRDLLFEASRATPLKDFMLLYGEGDHGGGPRRTDLEAILKFKDDPGHPRLEFVAPEKYFERLMSSGVEFPVVKKELNFAFPACYTTQAETKKWNRRLENLLLAAEKFSSLAVFSGFRNYYPERDLDEAWKTVLRHQFHDILDGSSIGPVYEETNRYYEEARERGERALDFSLETVTNEIETRGEGRPLVVYNSLAWERSEPVEVEMDLAGRAKSMRILTNDGTEVPFQVVGERSLGAKRTLKILFLAEKIPAMGYRVFRVVESGQAPAYKTGLAASPASLENECFRLALDPKTGWLKSLYDKAQNREILAGEGNVLQAIGDEPASMSAWELGLKDEFWKVGEKGARIEILEQGPVRAAIRVMSSFRDSSFIQDIILYSRVPRVDCRMRMDWQERNIMIKAAFPVAVRNGRADFEIPYGYVTRPADGTEVPALKWIDLTDEQGNYGVSLINDCKYGCDVKGNVLRLSIIHGATSPDPEADRGEHELVYSLFPHAGSWQDGATHRRAMELNNPLIARVAMVHGGRLPAVHCFIRVEPQNIVLSAVKKESGYEEKALILRLYETFGHESRMELELPWDVESWETDLIERPLKRIESDGKIVPLHFKPFEIKTIKIQRRARKTG
ncbi:MAG: glycoside hydrolase family 38 C-terminal domain-containing protein [Clostridiales bacterium]|nr:glycoside hydrolase family 38 C-terminal domain-containing protein [Clostridiales bacterium]